MKTTKLLLAIMSAMATAVIAQSCSTSYSYYYQIASIASNEGIDVNNRLTFKENGITITYNFWGEGGKASFAVYNENDEAVYLDLTKSFFIVNGIAYDYYKNRAWSSGNSHSYGEGASASTNFSGKATLSTYGGYYNGIGTVGATETATSSVSTSSSTTVYEKQGIWIPAHAAKTFYEYDLMSSPYRECGFDRFPKDDSTFKEFTEENSPYVYRNELAFTINEQPVVIDNDFYLCRLLNAPEEKITSSEMATDCNGNVDYSRPATKYIKTTGANNFYFKYAKSSYYSDNDTISKKAQTNKASSNTSAKTSSNSSVQPVKRFADYYRR